MREFLSQKKRKKKKERTRRSRFYVRSIRTNKTFKHLAQTGSADSRSENARNVEKQIQPVNRLLRNRPGISSSGGEQGQGRKGRGE